MSTSYLDKLATLADDEIDLSQAALALAGLRQKDTKRERYENHLKKLTDQTRDRHAELLDAGADDNIDTKLATLKHVMIDVHGYEGDEALDDNLDNASLMRVIDRGKGMPITLCVIVLHIGRLLEWQIDGLDVPGHFLCRLSYDGERVIFDPSNGFSKVEAPDLRQLIKKAKGEQAEISASYYEPTGNRKILIRLQNNIKYRQIDMEDYKGALETVQSMRLIDPQEYRLLLDAGVLYARTDSPYDAIDALEEYIKRAPQDRDRHDAAMLLAEIKDEVSARE